MCEIIVRRPFDGLGAKQLTLQLFSLKLSKEVFYNLL